MIDSKVQSKFIVRNKRLIKIPDEVFNLKNLRKLDLRNNSIKSIPKDIEKLKRLEVLDLSYNNIKFLYAGLFKILNINNGANFGGIAQKKRKC